MKNKFDEILNSESDQKKDEVIDTKEAIDKIKQRRRERKERVLRQNDKSETVSNNDEPKVKSKPKPEPKSESKPKQEPKKKKKVVVEPIEEEIAIPIDIGVENEEFTNENSEEPTEVGEEVIIETNEEVIEEKDTKKGKKTKKKNSKIKNFFITKTSSFRNGTMAQKITSILSVVALFTIIGVTLFSIFSNTNMNNTEDLDYNKYSISKEEVDLLMEKSINQNKPVNYYVLKEEHKPNFDKSGYILLEGLMTEASSDSVESFKVNGKNYKANSVISSWALKSDDKTLAELEENIPSLKIAIETALFNKDKEFYSNENSLKELVSFVAERVTGGNIVVELVELEGNFK